MKAWYVVQNEIKLSGPYNEAGYAWLWVEANRPGSDSEVKELPKELPQNAAA